MKKYSFALLALSALTGGFWVARAVLHQKSDFTYTKAAVGEAVDGLVATSTVGGVATSTPVVMTEEKIPTLFGVSSTTAATHQATPQSVKAIYMTSWVAGTPRIREHLLELLKSTELNAVVIDVKDATGKIAFSVEDPYLEELHVAEARVRDLPDLIRKLHEFHIYVIGRVAVFEDPYLPTIKPTLALHRKSTGAIWHDQKGMAWLDQRSPAVWEYIVHIAREAYAQGFDEINFDYVRFPSDGATDDIDYALPQGQKLDKPAELEKFFRYLHGELSDLGAPLSADLFGQITSSKDDMGIGQSIERAAPYFDYLAPMVYPSHYSPGFLNLKNPAAHPYEVVEYALLSGSIKLVEASSTPAKLRPWLQDFSLATPYTPAMVRAQIKATYDAGLTSWMLWDPGNHYSPEALLPK